ncbi:Hypothetical protein AAM4_1110 [Actinomyces succiniciruminis]|uniref:Uncharacterized protein n=1 Tax=Actinomyces succiniciruminis TaxID=1522002 RepID=A0A1L7RMS9_9ACTO|nr:Hypothetical protein AAM4_1110 [Actinomyces succiniciruminis]
MLAAVVAGVLRGEGRDEPAVVSRAGSPHRTRLHLTAANPDARKRDHLLRHFAICYATSGLTTPVNRLLKAPQVYSRALSSVVNAQPAHQTPRPVFRSQDIGDSPAAAHHTPKPEEPVYDTLGTYTNRTGPQSSTIARESTGSL